jgi:tetratricopeptide (TPR) repeat protein
LKNIKQKRKNKVMKNKIILFLLFLTNAPLICAASLFDQAQELQKSEHFAEAIAIYDTILATHPLHINALFNAANCHLAIGHVHEAIDSLERILRIDPTLVPVQYNLAYVQKTYGILPAAIEGYKNIIAQDPDYEQAHLGLGFAYLTYGDFENGWKQHQRYLKQSGKNGDALRELLATNTIAGKTVLLKPEGDLGDTLLFIRYAQRLHDLGATTMAIVQKPLIPLLSRCPYIDHLFANDVKSVPQFQASATVMSMPAIFDDREGTFPSTIPYLFPDPALVELWKEKLAHDTNFKIGICWQVCKKNDVSRLPIARRGCPLEKFFQLKDLKGVSFYSLQKYDGIEELADVPSDFPLFIIDDLDEEHGAFMDTAAIMPNLDLIITVDTSTVHLAGGLGCPVWLIHPISTDWRWIHDSPTSYWYPTLRIFKQQTAFDWDGVMQQVKMELRKLLNQ